MARSRVGQKIRKKVWDDMDVVGRSIKGMKVTFNRRLLKVLNHLCFPPFLQNDSFRTIVQIEFVMQCFINKFSCYFRNFNVVNNEHYFRRYTSDWIYENGYVEINFRLFEKLKLSEYELDLIKVINATIAQCYI